VTSSASSPDAAEATRAPWRKIATTRASIPSARTRRSRRRSRAGKFAGKGVLRADFAALPGDSGLGALFFHLLLEPRRIEGDPRSRHRSAVRSAGNPYVS